MDRDKDLDDVCRLQDMAPLLFQSDRSTHQNVSGCRAERRIRPEEIQFAAQPPHAKLYLAGVRLRVKTLLAALFELEVLNRIGHVTQRTIDAGFRQTFVEQPSGGADEGLPAMSS